MWDDDECQRRRLGRAELLSSWTITVAIVLAVVAWCGLRALLTDAAAPPIAESGMSVPADPPPALREIAATRFAH
jgi:hypothetical protein